MKIKFISLASGSSGNCYFLGTDRYGILVDAGIGIRTIKNIKRTWNRTGYHPGSIHNTRSCRPHQSSRAFRREIWNSCLLHSGSTCRNQQKLLHDREIIDLRTLSAQR